MVEQTPWLERRFRFDWEVGLYPCFLARLDGAPARIQELVGGVPGEILTVRVNGGWSIQEHIGHLLDLEALGERRLADFAAGALELTPAAMSNRKTWEADHNAVPVESILAEFREARRSLVRRMEAWGEDEAARAARHGRLGIEMRAVDWAYFMAEHDDHHIAAMCRLARVLTAGPS